MAEQRTDLRGSTAARLMTFLCDRGRGGSHRYASNGRFDLNVYWPRVNDEPMFEVRRSRNYSGSTWMLPGDLRWLAQEIELVLADIEGTASE